MQITPCETFATLSELAATEIVGHLQQKPDSLLCIATGNSPTGVYQQLGKRKSDFQTDAVRLIQLDEWYGLGPEDGASCVHYINQHLIQPLQIPAGNYQAFDGKAAEAQNECNRVNNWLQDNGPIDICILGIGKNGHLGFNEPAEYLHDRAHIANLSATSLTHTMLNAGTGNQQIQLGLTLGMADILQSKLIILLVNGTHKKQVMDQLMKRQISPDLPASFLWLHNNVHCFYCDNDD